MLRSVFFICVLLLSKTSVAFTMEFTETELQEKVSAMMPLEKKKYFITVIFTNPVVDLLESDNKIGITSDIGVKLPGGLQGNGNATITGSLRYDNDKGEFYLKDPVLNELTINKVPDKHLPKIKDIAQLALEKSMATKPIYKLKDNKLKQKLAKSLLKSIKVEKEKLFVELSAF